MYKGIIFDLDDTLIIETDFLFHGYEKVASAIALKNSHLDTYTLIEYLQNTFLKNGRVGLFQQLFQKYQINNFTIEECLSILRNDESSITFELIPKMAILLKQISELGLSVGILTNGNPKQQSNKIKRINWQSFRLDENFIIFANTIKPKPDPAALYHLLNEMRLTPAEALLIGDSEVDRICAKAAGVDFINIDSIV